MATPHAASAADPTYPTYSSDPVNTYGEPPPGQVVAGVRVVTGSDPSVRCPAGYQKRYPDLNMGLGTQVNGKPSDYVYTCLLFVPRNSLTPDNPGIGELYVSSPETADCHGSDEQVDGDLNSGMVRFDVVPEEKLFYCVHRPNTNGGSGYEVDPGQGIDPFPTPANKLLRDVQFLAWDPGTIPTCDTTDCVDTSPAGAFAYLEAAQTFDPYCQRYFGADYHPMFQPWEYHTYSNDRDSAVPQDSNAFDLNAGELAATMIYGCVAYADPSLSSTTVTMTTPPANVGQQVTLKALVYPTDGGGTVRFSSDGVTIAGCDTAGFASGGGDAWQALCSTTSLPQGTHTITATYSGDSGYSAATGYGQEVISATTTTTMSSSGTAPEGNEVDLKALVYPTDGGGTVRFASDGVTIPGCEMVSFNSGGGDAWQATCSTLALPRGTHTITATYTGDSAWASSTGSMSQIVTANPGIFTARLYPAANTMLTIHPDGPPNPGVRLIQAPSSGQLNDVWVFRPTGTSYEIVDQASGYCVTTDTIRGDALYLASCRAAPGQLWTVPTGFTTGSPGSIANPATGLNVDVSGGSTAMGAPIDGWPSTGGSPNQSFIPVAA